jgi:hypothetical protein
MPVTLLIVCVVLALTSALIRTHFEESVAMKIALDPARTL